jgi:hypothetical protein
MRNAQEISKLLKAGSHPIRIRLMLAMVKAPRLRYKGKGDERVVVAGGISPSKLVLKLAEDKLADVAPSLGVVAYHIRMLKKYGLVEEVRTAAVRGALEHYLLPTKLGRRFAKLAASLAREANTQ